MTIYYQINGSLNVYSAVFKYYSFACIPHASRSTRQVLGVTCGARDIYLCKNIIQLWLFGYCEEKLHFGVDCIYTLCTCIERLVAFFNVGSHGSFCADALSYPCLSIFLCGLLCWSCLFLSSVSFFLTMILYIGCFFLCRWRILIQILATHIIVIPYLVT